MGANLYGWRTYGDLGIIDGLNSPYPDWHALKLMQYFAQPGDSILPASSDYLLVSAYAAKRPDGTRALLLINKSKDHPFETTIHIDQFTLPAAGKIFAYGIPQDEAARLGTGNKEITTNSIPITTPELNIRLEPLSIQVIELPGPAALPKVRALPGSSPDICLIEITGAPGVDYILQESADFDFWNPVATNQVDAASGVWTEPVSATASALFFRAIGN
jgi:hypothetical protein